MSYYKKCLMKGDDAMLNKDVFKNKCLCLENNHNLIMDKNNKNI